MDVFQENDYRRIIKAVFENKPNHGHGQAARLARHLGVNTTLVSQILTGKRDFTEEQAVATAAFLGLNQKEIHYFLLLVQHARAAHDDLRAIYAQQIQKTRTEARSLKGRVSARKELSFEQQAVYYSSWTYAAVHTLVSIHGFDRPQPIARRLNLEEIQVRDVIERLLEYGLIAEFEGRYATGATSTYLPPDSPLIVRHHQSWRQMASQNMPKHAPRDYYFTAPFSISAADYDVFRKDLTELVGRLYKLVEKSKPEDLVCLNIDLFKV